MKEFDPKHAAENGYTQADWDDVDSSELTEKEFSEMAPLQEALPEFATKLREEIKQRGRPALDKPKCAVSIRLDADLVETLRASGKGWQSRANDILREAVGL